MGSLCCCCSWKTEFNPSLDIDSGYYENYTWSDTSTVELITVKSENEGTVNASYATGNIEPRTVEPRTKPIQGVAYPKDRNGRGYPEKHLQDGGAYATMGNTAPRTADPRTKPIQGVAHPEDQNGRNYSEKPQDEAAYATMENRAFRTADSRTKPVQGVANPEDDNGRRNSQEAQNIQPAMTSGIDHSKQGTNNPSYENHDQYGDNHPETTEKASPKAHQGVTAQADDASDSDNAYEPEQENTREDTPSEASVSTGPDQQDRDDSEDDERTSTGSARAVADLGDQHLSSSNMGAFSTSKNNIPSRMDTDGDLGSSPESKYVNIKPSVRDYSQISDASDQEDSDNEELQTPVSGSLGQGNLSESPMFELTVTDRPIDGTLAENVERSLEVETPELADGIENGQYDFPSGTRRGIIDSADTASETSARNSTHEGPTFEASYDQPNDTKDPLKSDNEDTADEDTHSETSGAASQAESGIPANEDKSGMESKSFTHDEESSDEENVHGEVTSQHSFGNIYDGDEGRNSNINEKPGENKAQQIHENVANDMVTMPSYVKENHVPAESEETASSKRGSTQSSESDESGNGAEDVQTEDYHHESQVTAEASSSDIDMTLEVTGHTTELEHHFDDKIASIQSASDSESSKSADTEAEPDRNSRQDANAMKTPDVNKALDQFLDAVLLFQCAGFEGQTAFYRVQQAILDSGYRQEVYPWHWHYTGGFAEGLPADVCNDWNLLVTGREYPIVIDKKSADEVIDQTNCVITQPIANHPIYLRLKQMNSESEHETFIGMEIFSEDRKSEVDGSHSSSALPMYKASMEDGAGDLIHCLRCPSWPSIASEYMSRSRDHNWPSENLLKKIEAAGCHVEAPRLLHPQSQSPGEWRWSFALAEKELINNTDRRTIACLYLLENILEYRWQKKNPPGELPVICSYHLKTACLWVREMAPVPDNACVLELARETLDWLIQRYQGNNLPHYFAPRENLISHLTRPTCQEMVTDLQEVRAQLWLHVMCSVESSRMLKHSVQSFQKQLGIHNTSRNKEINMGALLEKLLAADNAVELLDEAVRKEGPGSEEFKQEELYWLGQWSAAYYPKFQATMGELLPTLPASDLIRVPESILLPVVRNLDQSLEPMYAEMFRATLYRCMGQVYHGLFVHLGQPANVKEDKQETELAEQCKKKAVQYITEGLEIKYADGWSDEGISGHVNLAKLYYLSGDMEKLAEVLHLLEPLLSSAMTSPTVINGLPWLAIDLRHQLSRLPWQKDRSLYKSLSETCERPDTEINAVAVAYYFQARWALRGGNMEVVQEASDNMKAVRRSLWNKQQRQSTMALTSALCKEL